MGFIYIYQIYLMIILLTNVNYFVMRTLLVLCILWRLFVFLANDVSLVVGE